MAQEELEPLTPSVLAPAIVEAAEHAQFGVLISSGGGPTRKWEYVSAYIASLLECSPGELSARPASEIFPESVREGLEVWRDCRMAGEASAGICETELCAARGTRIPVRITAVAALCDERRVLVEFMVDLRDRLRTQRLLTSSEQRFQELIEVAPEALAIGTPEGFAYVNPAAMRLLGYESAEELYAIAPIEHVHPDDRRSIDERALHRPLTVRLRRRDRRWVEVELIALPIEWDGKPRLLGIGRDLGERRQLQAQLVQNDRLAAIGTLAAGVAHEINNPLAYVLLNLEYLLRELPKLPGDRQLLGRLLERLAEARHGAQRVSSIVSDLRAFSREDADERRPVDLALVLSSAAKVAEPKIAQRGRVIERYREVPLVLANAARLEQVFLNLLVNAGQALSTDGGGEVRIQLEASGGRVVVEIADNGAGIAPELLDRVFDPFFSTKPIGTGTGLGLPICHSIVTSLGGEIGVESQIGRGTKFRVSLPALSDQERLLTPAPISSDRIQSPRMRVLVVDDELPVASMLSRVLSDQHDVSHTTTARQALEMFLENPFDVVVCDLLMPGMSGMDLHRELSERCPGAEDRLVFMTGGAFTPRAAEFLARVENPRLEKPFDVSRLRRLLHEIFSKRTNDVR